MPVIEVFADVSCPFAHVALAAVARRLDRPGRTDVSLRVRAWPLELVNGEPLEPEATAEHVEALRTQVAPDLFTGFDPHHFPTTSLPALAVAAAAYRQGDGIGETVSFALRRALFEEGQDISRADVLARVARDVGVDGVDPEDDRRVLADWREGQARGVEGSPHFFCGDLEAFCPSLRITKADDGLLRIRRNVDALEGFLTGCLGG